MKQVKPIQDQTLFDIALQHHGSIEGVIQLAKLNGLTIGEPVDGQLAANDLAIDQNLLEELSSRSIKPASKYPVDITPLGDSNWILATGQWNDNGKWDDNATWID